MSSGSALSSTTARVDVFVAIVCTLVVGLFLFLPGDSIDDLDGGVLWALPAHADKVGHALLFLVETHCLRRALRWRVGESKALPLAIMGSLAYAGFSELLQLAIPLRSADGWDFLADSFGSFIYAVIYFWISKKNATGSAAEAAEWNNP